MSSQDNKALVLEAFDALFNQRDYVAAEQFWSERYVQHSAHIAPGWEGLFALVRAAPATLRYEHGLILAEGAFVMVHGRFSGSGRPAAWVAVDILRIEDGRLAEHWDVLQDEATSDTSLSGLPMFGDAFPQFSLPGKGLSQVAASADPTPRTPPIAHGFCGVALITGDQS